jgi:Na+-dependent transporters of the SNF family
MFALGILATLSQGPLLGGTTVFGKNCFDLFDFASSNVLLPLGGLAIALVAGWLLSRKDFVGELDKGYGAPRRTNALIVRVVQYLAPVLILLIVLGSLGILKL